MVTLGKWELDDLAKIKKERERKAERNLKEKEEEQKRQEDILEEKKKIAQKAAQDIEDQKNILYSEIDKGTTPAKIEQRKHYTEYLVEVLEEKNKDVESQKKNVDAAIEETKKAKAFLVEKSKEVNKLKEFRSEWAKKEKERLKKVEEEELNEIAELMFQSKLMREKEN